MPKRFILFVASCAVPALVHAQADPVQPRSPAQIGFGFSAANPDFANAAIKGVSIYGSIEIAHHIGIAGEINDLKLFTPRDIGETTYLYGARYSRDKGRFHPYGKALFGLGSFSYQKGDYQVTPTLHFTTYVIGGGVDFTVSRRINLRVFDFEYQFWPSFTPNGLTPYGGTIGAAYRF